MYSMTITSMISYEFKQSVQQNINRKKYVQHMNVVKKQQMGLDYRIISAYDL